MTERELEILVAAFYDGELSTAKRRVVADLLRNDVHAANYLVDLQNLSRFLDSLPVVAVPSKIVNAIGSNLQGAVVESSGLDPGDFLHDLHAMPDALVAEYVAGALSPSQASEVEDLLLADRDAQQIAAEVRQSRHVLAKLPRLGMPAEVGAKIRQAIEQEVASNSGNRPAGKSASRWSMGAVLTSYLDDELPPRRRALVERALARSRRGRLFLRHHAEIKLLLGDMAIAKLDENTYRLLVDKAVAMAGADRTGAVIAAAAETVPCLSHELPRPEELPAARLPVGGLRGFRWTSYVALAASVVLVLAFAELAFNRTGLLSPPNRGIAASNAASPPAKATETGVVIESKPLEGALRDPNAIAEKRDRLRHSQAEPRDLAWLAKLDSNGLRQNLADRQIRLTGDNADEIYNRVYLTLRQDNVELPQKHAIPDRRSDRSQGTAHAIAVDLSLTPLQWRGLFGMLQKMESEERLVAAMEVEPPSPEVVAALSAEVRSNASSAAVIVPRLALGAGPMANRNSNAHEDQWRPRSLPTTPPIAKNEPSKTPSSDAKAAKPGGSRLVVAKIRAVVVFEETKR